MKTNRIVIGVAITLSSMLPLSWVLRTQLEPGLPVWAIVTHGNQWGFVAHAGNVRAGYSTCSEAIAARNMLRAWKAEYERRRNVKWEVVPEEVGLGKDVTEVYPCVFLKEDAPIEVNLYCVKAWRPAAAVEPQGSITAGIGKGQVVLDANWVRKAPLGVVGDVMCMMGARSVPEDMLTAYMKRAVEANEP
jgi:hypothetical protein